MHDMAGRNVCATDFKGVAHVNSLVHIRADEHANAAADANKDVGMYIGVAHERGARPTQ
jgi:hypothetical protein